MKSYDHLYEQLISEENIRLAIKLSSRGKRSRTEVRKYFDNPDKYIVPIQEYVSHFKNAKHKPVEIYDGITRKKRTIIVPKYREQIVHHMLVNILKPIMQRSMYYHSYGSLPGKGAHMGRKHINRWIRNDKTNTKYCLKMDISKFFDSVPHDVLKAQMRKLIHDEEFLRVLFEVIDVTEHGLPLGFYTSQWLANWYLTELDYFIKQQLNAKYYMRYMDDMVIFSSDKAELHYMKKRIETYCNTNLGLSLKGNWQVFPIDSRALDYMGFRFFRNKTTLRKGILRKALRKAYKIYRKGTKPTLFEIRQMMSYFGWLSATDTYKVYYECIKPFFSFQYARRRISNHERGTNNDQIGLQVS